MRDGEDFGAWLESTAHNPRRAEDDMRDSEGKPIDFRFAETSARLRCDDAGLFQLCEMPDQRVESLELYDSRWRALSRALESYQRESKGKRARESRDSLVRALDHNPKMRNRFAP